MTFKMPIADALLVLNNYYTGDSEYSVAKGIPIAYLDSVREAVKSTQDGRIRVRFRGPRNHPTDNRPATLRQSVCLKKFATTFALYIDYK